MADQLIIRDMAGDASGQGLGRVAWLTANRVGLKGEYILARNDASARLNPANPFAPPLTVIGAPGYGPAIFDGAQLDKDNWFDTTIYDAQELTLMVAFKRSQGAICLIGNFTGTNVETTTSMLLDNTGVSGQVASYAGPMLTDHLPVPASDDWTIAMLRTTGLDNFTIKIDVFRGGQRLAGTARETGQKRYLAPHVQAPAFAIGSSRGTVGAGVYMGSGRFLFADIWHRCLSDADALTVAREWYSMGRACGQTV